MFLVESDNENARFHAAQSIVVFGGITIISLGMSFVQAMVVSGFLGFLLGVSLGLVGFVIWILALVLWIYLIIRTYQEQDPRIPVAAGIADSLARPEVARVRSVEPGIEWMAAKHFVSGHDKRRKELVVIKPTFYVGTPSL